MAGRPACRGGRGWTWLYVLHVLILLVLVLPPPCLSPVLAEMTVSFSLCPAHTHTPDPPPNFYENKLQSTSVSFCLPFLLLLVFRAFPFLHNFLGREREREQEEGESPA